MCESKRPEVAPAQRLPAHQRLRAQQQLAAQQRLPAQQGGSPLANSSPRSNSSPRNNSPSGNRNSPRNEAASPSPSPQYDACVFDPPEMHPDPAPPSKPYVNFRPTGMSTTSFADSFLRMVGVGLGALVTQISRAAGFSNYQESTDSYMVLKQLRKIREPFRRAMRIGDSDVASKIIFTDLAGAKVPGTLKTMLDALLEARNSSAHGNEKVRFGGRDKLIHRVATVNLIRLSVLYLLEIANARNLGDARFLSFSFVRWKQSGQRKLYREHVRALVKAGKLNVVLVGPSNFRLVAYHDLPPHLQLLLEEQATQKAHARANS